MNFILVLLTIIFITSIGYCILRLFKLEESDTFQLLAYSYGLGVGAVAFQLYLYSYLGIPWDRVFIILPWIFLFLFYAIRNERDTYLISFTIPKVSGFEAVLLTGTALSLGYVFLEAMVRPVMVWDGWAIWLLKSKIFFIDGSIQPGVFDYTQSDYPLIISLLGSFVYIILDQVDDTSVLLTSSAFLIALAVLFFTALNKYYGRAYALLFTFLLITTQNFIRHAGRIEAGQADLPLGYFIFACVSLYIRYREGSKQKVLVLLAIFMGITGLIKFDGIPFIILLCVFILYQIFHNKLFRQIPVLLLAVIPIVEWQVYKIMHNVSISYLELHPIQFSISKVLISLRDTIFELLRIKSWNMLWIMYFVVLFFSLQKKVKNLYFLHALIIYQLSIYLLMYFFFSGNSPESSIERLLIHIAPLAFLSIAIYVYPIFIQQAQTLFIKASFFRKYFNR